MGRMTTNDEHTHNEAMFDEVLMRLAAGMSPDEVLATVGDDAAWLRPLLNMVNELGELRQAIPIPPPEAGLDRFLAYGEKLASNSGPVSPP